MNTVSLEINGRKVEASEGTSILEAARSAGIPIPSLCYRKNLVPYGACRLCMVEIVKGGRSRLVASCVYGVEDGLEVQTDSPRVIKLRRTLLELMLANTPGAKAVEGYASRYGVSEPRFEVESPDACILCGLCVRYCAEIKQSYAIGFVGRGTERAVAFSPDIAAEQCPTCQECFSVCPTRVLSSIYKLQMEIHE